MQPAQNPALHHSVKNSHLRSLGYALLFLSVFRAAPPILAEIPQQIPLVPVVSVNQDKPSPEANKQTSKAVKEVSFEEKHKDWPAVILVHESRFTIHEDWSFETYIHRKVLIQTKEGSDLGQIPILYDADTDEVKILRAVAITPDGKEHSYARMQDISENEEYRTYSNSKRKTLFMPEVIVGTIIDLEYIKTTKRLPMPKNFWDIEHTDKPLPVKELKLSYRFPTNLGIKCRSFVPSWQPEIREKDRTTICYWERKGYSPDTDDAEVFPPLPTAENIGQGIELSSVRSWQDVAAWYYGLIQKNLKITPEIRKVAEKAAKGKTNPRDKTRAILEYVQENFRYVSMSFGDYSMEPHPTDEVFRNKYGDCKDQSLLVKAMLEAVGVRAELCLFGREDEESDPKDDLPVLGLYDHILLKVMDPKGGDFYADPLLAGYDIGEYPLQYQGAHIFIIGPKGGEFDHFPVFDETRLQEFGDETIEIRTNGSAVDSAVRVWALGESIDLRAACKAMTAEEKKKFFEQMAERIAGDGKTLELKIEGLDAKYGPITDREVTDRSNSYPVNDGLMVIDLPKPEIPDTWTAKKRKNPIFSPRNCLSRESLIYKIPEGFEIMHLPKGFYLENGFFSFRRDIERIGNSIKITNTRRMRRVELPASDYPKVREFYAKFSSRTKQRIILRKKGG